MCINLSRSIKTTASAWLHTRPQEQAHYLVQPHHTQNFTVPMAKVKDKGIYLSILKQAGIEDEGVS